MMWACLLAAFTVVMALMGVLEKERTPKAIYWLAAMGGMCVQAMIGGAQ